MNSPSLEMTDCGAKIGAFPDEDGGSNYSRQVLMKELLKGRQHTGCPHQHLPSAEKGLTLRTSSVTIRTIYYKNNLAIMPLVCNPLPSRLLLLNRI